MKLEYMSYAFKNIKERKLRSGLTIVSILIGITAIFALVSFGYGVQEYINVVAQEAGVDKLFIQARGIGAPGTDENFFISKDDVDFVNKVNGVAEATGIYMTQVEIKQKKKTQIVFGTGYDVNEVKLIEESFTVTVETGRQLRKGDADKVVLGYNYQIPDKIFEQPILLGEKMEVGGELFEVVGFYEEVGNPQDDSNIYFSLEGFESLFPEKKDQFAWVMVRAETNIDVNMVADRVQEKLRKHKDQEKGKEDFFVQTFEDALQTFGNIITVLNGILFLIALISLIVASVNTMNTMYTAVLERTKEVGIMKAIGARNEDILFLFIFESGFIGMVGGVLGVLLGYLIASAGGAIAAASGFSFLQPVYPIGLIVGCVLFSFAVGAASGVLPARQASKLKPIDALRYE